MLTQAVFGIKLNEQTHKGTIYMHIQWHKHTHVHNLVPPVDGICAAAGDEPFLGIMRCVITRTLLWDTAHLNELVLLFLKIIHPFIPTPLTLIKMIFFLNLILAKGRRGGGEVFCATAAIKQSELTKLDILQARNGQYGRNINTPGEISGA